MANNIKFTQDGSKYVYEFNPDTAVVIQVDRESKEDFTVYGFMDDMNPVALFSTSILQNLLFEVDVPEGVTIRIVSWSPVVSAKIIEQ